MSARYESEPTKDSVENLEGPAILEFGTNWCGYCQAAQPVIAAALARHSDIRHLKIEDGKGRPLGRAYRVKLWPTLIFLKDGSERARVVRPTDSKAIEHAIAQLAE